MESQKTYLFAGASSHIAISTSSRLRSQGHKVIGISRNNASPHYDEFHLVEGYHKNNLPSVQGEIHGMVYFPGTINLKPFARLSTEDLNADFEINTFGAIYFVQHYLNQLKAAESSSVVFISTVAVKLGMPFHSSISAAKGALEGLVPALAAELAPKIRVNAIAPSLTHTNLSERFINTPEKQEAAKQRNPMKKIGTPEELSAAVCFLLSTEASWITGQTLAVDGGMGNLKL